MSLDLALGECLVFVAKRAMSSGPIAANVWVFHKSTGIADRVQACFSGESGHSRSQLFVVEKVLFVSKPKQSYIANVEGTLRLIADSPQIRRLSKTVPVSRKPVLLPVDRVFAVFFGGMEGSISISMTVI